MSTAPQTLARRTLGVGTLVILGVVASSPLTVLVGGIPSTYAGTGVVGVPASFLVIMCVLGLLAVGYLSATRYLPHPAPFYAVLARGLSGQAGTAGAVISFVGYNAIQISLLPFLGAQLAALLGGVWWVWAAAAWALIGLTGLARMTTNAVFLGGLLLVELSVVGLFVAAALTHPAEPPPLPPFTPEALVAARLTRNTAPGPDLAWSPPPPSPPWGVRHLGREHPGNHAPHLFDLRRNPPARKPSGRNHAVTTVADPVSRSKHRPAWAGPTMLVWRAGLLTPGQRARSSNPDDGPRRRLWLSSLRDKR